MDSFVLWVEGGVAWILGGVLEGEGQVLRMFIGQ